MDLKEHIECLRSTADAMERCVDGVPSGHRVECSAIHRYGPPSWSQTTTKLAREMRVYLESSYYRLVPIPQPRRIPHTRETWPGWRYVEHTTIKGRCARATGTFSERGVWVQTAHGGWECLVWTDLMSYRGGNSPGNINEPLSVVVNE